MRQFAWMLITGIMFALLSLCFCTVIVLIVSFSKWEWIGYNWEIVRFFCGLSFFAGGFTAAFEEPGF